MTAYRITRDIDKREQPWMEIRAGEIVYAYTGCTYGCIGDGLAVSRRRGETPFFEVPKDAIEPINAHANRRIVYQWLRSVGRVLSTLPKGRQPASANGKIGDLSSAIVEAGFSPRSPSWPPASAP